MVVQTACYGEERQTRPSEKLDYIVCLFGQHGFQRFPSLRQLGKAVRSHQMAAFGNMGNRAFEFGRHVQSQLGRNMCVVVGNQAVFGHVDFAQDVEIGGCCFNVGIERRQGRQRIGKTGGKQQAADFLRLLAAEEVKEGNATEAVAD